MVALPPRWVPGDPQVVGARHAGPLRLPGRWLFDIHYSLAAPRCLPLAIRPPHSACGRPLRRRQRYLLTQRQLHMGSEPAKKYPPNRPGGVRVTQLTNDGRGNRGWQHTSGCVLWGDAFYLKRNRYSPRIVARSERGGLCAPGDEPKNGQPSVAPAVCLRLLLVALLTGFGLQWPSPPASQIPFDSLIFAPANAPRTGDSHVRSRELAVNKLDPRALSPRRAPTEPFSHSSTGSRKPTHRRR
ncbi:MAG: hypothetical protein KatS3mg077_3068 [Candidatus Binatia bacterium]|nr:MAG: hypothetical protein KatS3mg077_3068 [Candidatus Binatia bacterium]